MNRMAMVLVVQVSGPRTRVRVVINIMMAILMVNLIFAVTIRFLAIVISGTKKALLQLLEQEL